jgi:transposase
VVDLASHRECLYQLTRTDPDPRVRHRADGLLLLADGMAVCRAARLMQTADGRLRAWRARSLAAGRAGLADRPRAGRPPKLDATARQQLEAVLDRSPLDEGYPVTTWTVADLTDWLARHGWVVHAATVYRALHALGFVYRRPKHDLTHRQDAAAVATAQHALAELQKRGLLPGRASASSTSMSATSTPIPTWSRSGSGPAIPGACPPPAPTSGTPSLALSTMPPVS